MNGSKVNSSQINSIVGAVMAGMTTLHARQYLFSCPANCYYKADILTYNYYPFIAVVFTDD